MKTIFTLTSFIMVCLGLSAGTPNGQSPYIPYHVLVNQHFDLNQLANNRNGANASQRSLEWKIIAEREDKYDDTTSAWIHLDSILAGYNQYGTLDTEFELTYTNGNWQNDIEVFEMLTPAGVDTFGIEYQWDAISSSYVNYEILRQTLDAGGNVTLQAYQYWINNAWQNTSQTISTYDGNHNNLTYISQNWNTNTNSWVNSQKGIYTYDANNAELSALSQNWDTILTSWVNVNQDLYTNNSGGKHTVDVYQQWKYGMWENNVQYLYAYDAANNDTLYVTQSWDSAAVQWNNSYKYNYSYDANNNQTYELYSNWDAINLVWNPSYQYAYTYVNGHLNSTELEQSWNSGSSTWENYYKYQYNYDGNFNETGYTTYIWNSGNSTWQGDYSNTYNYDAYNNQIYELDQNFNTNNLTFENTYQYFYYYKQLNVEGINQVVNQINVSLYPNPSTGKNIELHADMDQPGNVRVGLYNAGGKLVTTAMHQFEAGANTLQLNYNIAAGTYYVQVLDYTTGKSSVLKLVKQ